MNDGLNHRQREFVRLFIAGPHGVRGVASKSYLRAGYCCDSRSAEVSASRLLQHPGVRAAIADYHSQADELAEAQTRRRFPRDPMVDVMAQRLRGEVVEV